MCKANDEQTVVLWEIFKTIPIDREAGSKLIKDYLSSASFVACHFPWFQIPFLFAIAKYTRLEAEIWNYELFKEVFPTQLNFKEDLSNKNECEALMFVALGIALFGMPFQADNSTGDFIPVTFIQHVRSYTVITIENLEEGKYQLSQVRRTMFDPQVRDPKYKAKLSAPPPRADNKALYKKVDRIEQYISHIYYTKKDIVNKKSDGNKKLNFNVKKRFDIEDSEVRAFSANFSNIEYQKSLLTVSLSCLRAERRRDIQLHRSQERNTESFVAVKKAENFFNLVAFVDSGAAECCISPDLVTEHKLENMRIQCNPIRLSSATGTDIITEYIAIPCQINDNQYEVIRWYVLPEGAPKKTCLLGLAAFEKFKLTIQCGSLSKMNPESKYNPYYNVLRAFKSVDECKAPEYDDFMRELDKELLPANAKMKEQSLPCDHPDAEYKAMLDIDLKKSRELWSCPKNYNGESQQIITTQKEEWIRDKVVEKLGKNTMGYAKVNFVLVKQPGKIRVCIDATNFNKGLQLRKNFIPNISELFDSIKRGNCNYITALDISKAYFVCGWDRSQFGLMYFEHDGERYGFRRTPFGLADLPEHFVNLMNKIFGDMKENVKVYFDDILIISKNYEEHLETVKEVIRRCNKWKLPLNIEKSHFCRKQVKYLGYILNDKGVMPDPEKVDAIQNAPTPTNYTELASFLGLLNFNRRFMPNLSTKTAILHGIAAKQKDDSKKKFSLEDQLRVEEHTRICREAMAKSLMLAHPPTDEPDVEYSIYCDASEVGMGGCICYKGKDDDFPIPFGIFSRSFKDYERNYTIPKKEFFAMVATCKYFEHFLYDKHFIINTDHIALTFLLSETSTLHRTFSGWLNDMSKFSYSIRHVAGKDNGFADYLSRYAHINSSQTREALSWDPKGNEMSDKIYFDVDEGLMDGAEHKDFMCALATIIRGNDIKPKNKHIVPELDYLTPSEEERLELVKKFHENSHVSEERLFYSLLDEGYWWKEMRHMCGEVRKSCLTCHSFNDIVMYHKVATRTPTSSGPWNYVQIDLSGPKSKPTDKKHLYFLIVICVFTGFIVVRTLQQKSAEHTQIALREIFSEMGCPAVVQSDVGGEFINKTCENWFADNGITHNVSAPHNPSTNGKVERAVKTVGTLLNKLVHKNPATSWDELLFEGVRQINNTTTPRLKGFSPFFAMHLRRAQNLNPLKQAVCSAQTYTKVEDWITTGEGLRSKLDKELEQINEQVQKKFKENDSIKNKKVISERPLVGTTVFKKNHDMTNKSHVRWYGPYTVTGHDKYHNHYLKYANGNDPDTINQADKRPIPLDHLKVVSPNALEAAKDVYVINRVLDYYDKFINGKWERFYLIQWSGYGNDSNSYEPASNVEYGNKVVAYEGKLDPSLRFKTLFPDPTLSKRPKVWRSSSIATQLTSKRKLKK